MAESRYVIGARAVGATSDHRLELPMWEKVAIVITAAASLATLVEVSVKFWSGKVRR